MGPLDRGVFAALSLMLALAVGQFALYWVGIPEWSTRPGVLVLLTGALILFTAQFLHAWTTLPAMVRPVSPPPSPGLRVAMVTTFVPGAEPLDMLEATVRAMVAVRVPHDVWVLDEADDPEVAALCGRLGVAHFSRAGRPDLSTAPGPLKSRTKYGNVNAWLRAVGFDAYDVVAAFDPDHVPSPGFLESTLGFFRDPGVGFVQGAQVYYNQESGFIARGAAEETYGYYSSTLMGAFGVGYSVMVGCHNVHRVTALRDIGGLAPHDADDLLTALHYEAAGWRGVYVPELLAAGLTPATWPAYLIQQRRWARSVLDLKLRHLPRLWSRLRPTTRVMSLFQGAGYPGEAILPAAGALLLTWLLVTGETSILSRLFGHQLLLLLLALGAVNLFRRRFFLIPEVERGLHWRAGLLRAAKWPFIGWGLFEALRGVQRPYQVTWKTVESRRGALFLLPHLVLGLVVGGVYVWSVLTARPLHWSLHFWSPVVAGLSLWIFASAFLPRPRPFDPRLLDRWTARG